MSPLGWTKKSRRSPVPDTSSPMHVSDNVWSSVIAREAANGAIVYDQHSWTKKTLAPYTKFKKLVGERKFASKYPETPSKYTFTDLPAEIRDMIYSYALCHKHNYVELSPKSTGSKTSARCYWQCYRAQIRKQLGLLRVSKVIGAEAACIYYGETEFRFTDNRGWYILPAFLRTIGLANVSRLRSIAVHVPWYGNVHDDAWHDQHHGETNGSIAYVRQQLDRIGLKTSRHHWQQQLTYCVRSSVRALEVAGTLRHFTLVLPDAYQLCRQSTDAKGVMDVSEAIDESKFKALNLSLIRLQGGLPEADQFDILTDSIKSQRTATRLAALHGWDVKTVGCGKLGEYPLLIPANVNVVELDDL